MNRTYADTIEDIKNVMAFTGCTEDDAILALLDTGSIEEAIAQILAKESIPCVLIGEHHGV